jgi:hypothetical protein
MWRFYAAFRLGGDPWRYHVGVSEDLDRAAHLAAALGEPRLPVWRRDDAAPLEASTIALVEMLLGRLARASIALGDRERSSEVDRLVERLLLCDLALTAGALRALDAAAAERLAEASTELERARADFERSVDRSPLGPQAT